VTFPLIMVYTALSLHTASAADLVLPPGMDWLTDPHYDSQWRRADIRTYDFANRFGVSDVAHRRHACWLGMFETYGWNGVGMLAVPPNGGELWVPITAAIATRTQIATAVWDTGDPVVTSALIDGFLRGQLDRLETSLGTYVHSATAWNRKQIWHFSPRPPMITGSGSTWIASAATPTRRHYMVLTGDRLSVVLDYIDWFERRLAISDSKRACILGQMGGNATEYYLSLDLEKATMAEIRARCRVDIHAMPIFSWIRGHLEVSEGRDELIDNVIYIDGSGPGRTGSSNAGGILGVAAATALALKGVASATRKSGGSRRSAVKRRPPKQNGNAAAHSAPARDEGGQRPPGPYGTGGGSFVQRTGPSMGGSGSSSLVSHTAVGCVRRGVRSSVSASTMVATPLSGMGGDPDGMLPICDRSVWDDVDWTNGAHGPTSESVPIETWGCDDDHLPVADVSEAQRRAWFQVRADDDDTSRAEWYAGSDSLTEYRPDETLAGARECRTDAWALLNDTSARVETDSSTPCSPTRLHERRHGCAVMPTLGSLAGADGWNHASAPGVYGLPDGVLSNLEARDIGIDHGVSVSMLDSASRNSTCGPIVGSRDVSSASVLPVEGELSPRCLRSPPTLAVGVVGAAEHKLADGARTSAQDGPKTSDEAGHSGYDASMRQSYVGGDVGDKQPHIAAASRRVIGGLGVSEQPSFCLSSSAAEAACGGGRSCEADSSNDRYASIDRLSAGCLTQNMATSNHTLNTDKVVANGCPENAGYAQAPGVVVGPDNHAAAARPGHYAQAAYDQLNTQSVSESRENGACDRPRRRQRGRRCARKTRGDLGATGRTSVDGCKRTKARHTPHRKNRARMDLSRSYLRKARPHSGPACAGSSRIVKAAGARRQTRVVSHQGPAVTIPPGRRRARIVAQRRLCHVAADRHASNKHRVSAWAIHRRTTIRNGSGRCIAHIAVTRCAAYVYIHATARHAKGVRVAMWTMTDGMWVELGRGAISNIAGPTCNVIS